MRKRLAVYTAVAATLLGGAGTVAARATTPAATHASSGLVPLCVTVYAHVGTTQLINGLKVCVPPS